MSTVKNNFDDIRSFRDHEVKTIINELLNDSHFKAAAEPAIHPITWEQMSIAMRNSTTVTAFQRNVIVPVLMQLIKRTTTETVLLNSDKVKKGGHVLISNHRDIVLDAAYLNVLLHAHQIETAEIAAGDNLLAYPWIEKIMRLNKTFLVKRSVGVRQMLEQSKHLSDYIHDTIKRRKQSVWIAQREGRAKDSNDKTQTAMLKMLALHNSSHALATLKELSIVPLAISYELDPTDYLKAKELQQKRDNPDFKKSKADDVLSMMTGIMGFKGNVVFQFGDCINHALNAMPIDTPKNEVIEKTALLIDSEIYKNYVFFPFNYVAYDMMMNESKFVSEYTEEGKQKFEAYLQGQIDKIDLPNKDVDYLRNKIIEMYANPLKNHLSAK